jgi:hypothetical protein
VGLQKQGIDGSGSRARMAYGGPVRASGGEQRAQARKRDGFFAKPVAPGDGGGSGERIQNRFFCGLNRGGYHRIEVGVGQMQ